MVDVQRIVCPIDFSDASRHALEHAAVSARWHRAHLRVIHVYSTPEETPQRKSYGSPMSGRPTCL